MLCWVAHTKCGYLQCSCTYFFMLRCFSMDLFTSKQDININIMCKYSSSVHSAVRKHWNHCSRTVRGDCVQTHASSKWMCLTLGADRHTWIARYSQPEPCWCSAAILWEVSRTLHSIDGVMTAGPGTDIHQHPLLRLCHLPIMDHNGSAARASETHPGITFLW